MSWNTRAIPGGRRATSRRLLRPGGLVFVSAAWSQAFHATPDDLWRFSVRGLMRLFGRLEIVSAFYSGGDVGLDVAYRVVRDGKPELDPRSGAVEQGLFQLVLDHEDNRAVLARQATERLPVSRTYMPTLFVNIVGRAQLARRPGAQTERAGFRPLFPFVDVGLRLEAQVHTEQERPAVAAGVVGRAARGVHHRAAGHLHARSERVVGTDFPLVDGIRYRRTARSPDCR